jgi:two-component system, NarL family, nitrate/nitrite response regulator NarL
MRTSIRWMDRIWDLDPQISTLGRALTTTGLATDRQGASVGEEADHALDFSITVGRRALMSNGVRVFVVAEVRLYREGLAQVLERDERVTVIGAASHVDEVLDTLGVMSPDVILLSTALDEAYSYISTLVAVAPEAKVIALAVPAVEDQVVAWAEAGAHGFLTCEGSLEDLILAIESAIRDEIACPPRLAAALLRRVGALAAEHSAGNLERRLTLRERQISELLDEGLSNKEIATRLHIELTTVKNHVHNILEKLQVRSRGEAVARLRRRSTRPEINRHATKAASVGYW